MKRAPEAGHQPEEGASRVALLYAPVDNASLILFRIVFGAILTWDVSRFLSEGWIRPTYIEPEFHFKYLGFGWVEPLPGDGMLMLFALLGVAAVGITLGLFYRFCALIFGVGWLYVFLLEEVQYLNHYYLVILICFQIACMPLHASWSVDAMMNPSIRSRTAPAWALWLIRIQIGIVYFYAGLAKFKWDWLAGRPTLFMWLNWAEGKAVVESIPPELAAYGLSYGGLLLDLLVVPLLLWRRTRWAAFCAALFFHASNKLLFKIGIFPYFMIAVTTLYFDPDWPRRLWRRLRRVAPIERGRPIVSAPAAPISVNGRRKLWAGVLGLYLLIQLLVPLRHHLYPGTVIWTEEGQYFAWHMLLRMKRFRGKMWVTDPATGEKMWIDPHKYLPKWQADAFGKRPDMIVQFAHYLDERLEARGMKDQEIRAEIYASLNGRPAELLIDPEIDLTEVRRSLWPRSYVLPLTHPLPPMSKIIEEIKRSRQESPPESVNTE